MSDLVERKKFIILCSGMLATLESDKKKKRKWVKEWLTERSLYSDSILVKKLRLTELQDYKHYLRMSDSQFDYVLKLIESKISKKNTLMRSAITAEERLIVTLRYLATGNDYSDLQYSSRISVSAISQIVPETCREIYNALKYYIKLPSTPNEWKCISEGFKNQWNFENCIGAIDGKHVLITKPANSGSSFYNYKGTFSIVLFAIVNSNYEFIYIHEGINGRISDGGILRKTKFFKKLEKNELHIPEPQKLEKSGYVCPYGFIGDEAFSLSENIWKPYPHAQISREERIFNYRLSRARRVVENAFGILCSRFKVFQKPIKLNLQNTDAVVLACCVLHNFLRKESSEYISQNLIEREDLDSGTIISGNCDQFVSLKNANSGKASHPAKEIRDKLCEYYNNEGKVEFQYKMCNLSCNSEGQLTSLYE